MKRSSTRTYVAIAVVLALVLIGTAWWWQSSRSSSGSSRDPPTESTDLLPNGIEFGTLNSTGEFERRSPDDVLVSPFEDIRKCIVDTLNIPMKSDVSTSKYTGEAIKTRLRDMCPSITDIRITSPDALSTTDHDPRRVNLYTSDGEPTSIVVRIALG